MMRNSLILLGLIFFALIPVHAVEFSTAEYAGRKATVCKVNIRTEKLQLYLENDWGKAYRNFSPLDQALKSNGKKLVFAMNAGMHGKNFAPMGLYVEDGTVLVPLNTTNGVSNFYLKPNGVFFISDKGAAVVETSEFNTNGVTLATQSGPLLLRNGVIHPEFKQDSKNRFIRNGVGILSPDTALFVISDNNMNFYEFAALFRDVLKCPDALCLDSVMSSLYAPQIKRNDKTREMGPIIGIEAPISAALVTAPMAPTNKTDQVKAPEKPVDVPK